MSGRSEVRALIDAHERLRAHGGTEATLAAGADLAREACGFARGLIAVVGDGVLTGAGCGPLADPASDALRRRLVARPLTLVPGTEEAERLRRVRRLLTRAPLTPRRQLLADRLELGEHVYAPIAPDGVGLALLVLDRPSAPPTAEETALVDAYAGMIGIALDREVLRRRVDELAQEVRQFAGVTRALALEALDAPPALGSEHGIGPATAALPERSVPAHELLRPLSDHERRVAALVAAGRSNREIADELVIAVETAKSHVARILRKVGAANRVELAALVLRAGAADTAGRP